ncbi:MAG: peptide chain release factor N(5)-glutamine methyltransferase [Candidatus Babeliales bacterium]
MKYNVIILIQEIADQLKHIYEDVVEQQQVAWWLLQAVTQKTKVQLIAQETVDLTEIQEATLKKWIQEHSQDLKPLQYILGSVPFCNLEILVEPPVLIPRPETEEWCCELIEQLKQLPDKNIMILDLCSGSGCIALALAKALPQATVIGTDISEHALALAQKNAQHNKLLNIKFLHSDIYDKIPQEYKFDLIVSNPPYIAPEEWQNLSPMVKKWEEKIALVADDQGLTIIRKIIDNAHNWLRQNPALTSLKIPQLIIEIGYKQGQVVKSYMENATFKNVQIKKDLSGKDRIVTGRL